MTTLPRRSEEEILDGEGLDPEVLRASLAQVEAVDRWLGGSRAMRRHLAPLVHARQRLEVLDVGTGDGELLRRQIRWLTARGARVRAVGLDAHPEILAVAAARRSPDDGVRLVRGDGLALPFADDAFDVVVSTLTLHHFEREAAVRLLAEMRRVARVRVLVGDLERGRLNYLGARLLAATVWRRNPITRHDGPLSVLRAFTAPEARALARSAGFARARVRRHAPFRLVLDAEP